MAKNVAFRDGSNASKNDEKNDDDADKDSYKGVEDTRNESTTQTPPQTPNNSRSRHTHSDKHYVTLGRVANSNPNMTKAEEIKILGVNRYFSSR